MTERQTQADRVFQYMEEHGTITYRQMMVELNINSPRDIILQLKRDGVPIQKERVNYIQRDGRKGHYHKFSIKEN